MASCVTQLKGLVWRNFLIKKRGWKLTILEVLAPLTLVVTMILISIGVETNVTQVINDFPSQNFSPTAFLPAFSGPILASPDLPFTSDVMKRVTQVLNVTAGFHVTEEGNVTSAKLEASLPQAPGTRLAGVEFLLEDGNHGPQVNGYVLRLPKELVRDVVDGCSYTKRMGNCGNTAGVPKDCPSSQVITSGLLSLQWAVETALIQTFKDPSFKPPDLQLQMMPLPAFRPGSTNTQLLMCVSMVIALSPLAFFVTFSVVTEKKMWSKIMLRTIGISDSVFWLCWWVPYAVETLVIGVLSTILVALAGFFASSGLGIYFLLVILYCATLIGFSFIVAIFFNSPKIAGALTAVLTILLGLLYLAVSLTRSFTFTSNPGSHAAYSKLPFGVQLFFSFFSPVAFALGLDRAMYDYEEANETNFTDGQFPLMVAILMLIADIVLYFVLALYLDCVLHSNQRLTHSPWFFLTPSYWQGKEHMEEEVLPTDTPEGPHIEPPSLEIIPATAIRIRDLSKQYNNGQKNPAFGLNGLDLDIFEGQITCILGHPSAGKSTLLNIMAGIVPATSGIVFVYDLDACNIRNHYTLATTVALVPQHNVLLDDQSVEEHMRITAVLRGIEQKKVASEIEACLDDVELLHEKKKQVKDLSGCQKRRLSLALALLANSKVLLMDEPGLGMETEHLHSMWNMLHAKKAGRVIIFTSRHMEEADIFADRKVVLSNGRLRCVGSSLFLRQHFNVGYQLQVTMQPLTSSIKLLRLVKSHIRGVVQVVKCEDSQLTISIPHSLSGRLPGLLKRLESKDRGGESLGVQSFTIVMSSLSQIFWRLEGDDMKTARAEEEEAGNVFISPLLTPSDDVFNEADDLEELRHRESALRPSMSRTSTSERLEELAKRFSAHSTSYRNQDSGSPVLYSRQDSGGSSDNGSAINKRSSSLKLRPVIYQRSSSDPSSEHPEEEGTSSQRPSGRKVGGIMRNVASFLIKNNAQQGEPRPRSISEINTPDPNGLRHTSDMPKPKPNKNRSKSFGIKNLRRNRTSESLSTSRESQMTFDSNRPTFQGLDIPHAISNVEREHRASSGAFKDIKRTGSVHSMSGMSYLNDGRSNLGLVSSISDHMPDPFFNLMMVDEQKRESSNKKMSSLQQLVSQSIQETSFIMNPGQANTKDPQVSKGTPAPKFAEALANIGPELKGWRLEVKKWTSMLRVRALQAWRIKCNFLARLSVPLVFTVISVLISHATTSLTVTKQQEMQVYSLGIQQSLHYRDQTGGNISNLLSQFSTALSGSGSISEYTSKTWNSSSSVESVMDILQSDGGAYKFYYNASCPLSLSHLTSLVCHMIRDNKGGNVSSVISGTTLAPRVSGRLQPWPPVTREEDWGALHWVAILFLGLALLITPCSYASRMLTERQKGIRSYLRVAGVSPLMFYGTAFVVDVLESLVAAVVLIIICCASQMVMFETEGASWCLVILMILSVPVGVLWAYVSSFAFSRPRMCLVFMLPLLVLITSSMYLLVHFLEVEDRSIAAHIVHHVFTVLWPPYIRFGGLHYIEQVAIGGREGIPVSYFFDFASDIDICFIMLGIDIVVLSIVVFILDKLTSSCPTTGCTSSGHMDADANSKRAQHENFRRHSSVLGAMTGVEREIQRVQELQGENSTSLPLVVVNGMTKLFTQKKRHMKAVDNTSFVIQKGEVLGLLGPHESGKSTVLNAMLGVCPFSEGIVYLESEKVSAGQIMGKMAGKVGFCPQDNPLWDDLSLDQHMRLMGGLRGLSKKDTDSIRNSLFHDLNLNEYRSNKVGKLSDSEKRKLCFAMSMLGKQNVLVLDDPSVGLDLRSRRLYWDAMNYFIKTSQRAAIVSTRCVEEAQTLCSRMAVFVNGQLRCLGTKEELQALCKQTYRLEIWLRGWDMENGPQRMEIVTMLLRELFPEIILKDQFMDRAVFTVNISEAKCENPEFSLAKVFDNIESIKRNLDLQDFTFSQATLDQVFLDLSRDQHEGDGKFISDCDSIAESTPILTPCIDTGESYYSNSD